MNVIKYVVIALAGVAIIAGFLNKQGKIGRRVARRSEVPLITLDEYLKPIDPDIIGYDQVKQIKIKMSKTDAFTIDGEDNLYVAGASELLVLNSRGKELSRIPLEKPARCLALGTDDRIYLGLTDRVQVLNKDGTVESTWESLNEKALITSIAVTIPHVYVADAGNKVVVHYNNEGQMLGKIGERDVKNGKLGFIIPSPYFDIAIGYEGNVWAVNSGRHALENYSLDGELRSSWQRTSVDVDGFSGCCNPTHIAVLPNGAFVTVEKGIPRVKIHDQSGDFSTVVAGPDRFAEGTVLGDLAVDSHERILVLDPKTKTIQIFDKKQIPNPNG